MQILRAHVSTPDGIEKYFNAKRHKSKGFWQMKMIMKNDLYAKVKTKFCLVEQIRRKMLHLMDIDQYEMLRY